MLERRRFVVATAALILCATLLHWGSIDDGLILDDVAIYGRLAAAKAGHPGAHWWDVFFLGGYSERLRFSGALPWWVAEGVQLHFFRPVAAATHYLDVLVWPDDTEVMHVHNLAWFALMGAAVAWLYREALASRTETFLAVAVFVLAYFHEWPVLWLAARNSLMALGFGAVSLAGFRRWQDDWRWRVLAGGGLALSLLSSELGVSILAFVISLELARPAECRAGRLWRLGLAFGVVIAWRAGYVLGGYGAIRAGTYVDPLSAPGAFLYLAPKRLMLQALTVVGPPELLMHPAVPLAWRIGFWILGGGALVLVLRATRDRDVWPWAFGAGLCFIPLVASVPQPRLLGFMMLGLAPLVARALVRAWTRGTRGRIAAGVIAVHQLLLGPLLLSGMLDGLRPNVSELGEPGTELGDLKGRNLILLNPPTYASAKTVAAVRATRGLSMPSFAWALGIGENIEIRREGCCTLVLRQPDGMYRERWAAMYRGPQVPFVVGDTVKTLAFVATIRAVTDRGFAKEVAFEMTGPLRSRQFVFARWTGRDYAVVTPREIPRGKAHENRARSSR